MNPLLHGLDAPPIDPGNSFTWDVLPPELKARGLVEQLAAEYDWTRARMKERGLA
jgi:hypothetical protein